METRMENIEKHDKIDKFVDTLKFIIEEHDDKVVVTAEIDEGKLNKHFSMSHSLAGYSHITRDKGKKALYRYKFIGKKNQHRSMVLIEAENNLCELINEMTWDYIQDKYNR